jgi:hypothetical protein
MASKIDLWAVFILSLNLREQTAAPRMIFLKNFFGKKYCRIPHWDPRHNGGALGPETSHAKEPIQDGPRPV